MPNLEECPNQWNAKTRECKAVIDTPKGRRNKFRYDPEYQAFSLSGLLPEGLAFPYDFGFIPSTLGEDGDPVDIMLLMEEPAHVGCVLDVRVIGVIEAEQVEQGKRFANHRLIGVAVHSYAHQDLHSIEEVPKSVLAQLEEFFSSYNRSRGKQFKPKGRYGPSRAAALVNAGIAAFKKNKGK